MTRKSLDIQRQRTARDNWFNPNADPSIQQVQIVGHRKQLAYEAAREQHRLDYPPVPRELCGVGKEKPGD